MINTSEIIIIALICVLLIFVIVAIFLIFSINNKFKIFQDETMKYQDDIKKFIYEKIISLDTKQIESSKNIQVQTEKNSELFIKISLSLETMQSNLNITLHEKLELLGEKVRVSLKEQQLQGTKDIESLAKKVDERLELINEKVENRLKTGFESIDKTFKDIITGITKINEAQRNIESLSTEVTSLQNILTDKKTRGIFGEVQLNSILKSIFGEKEELYRIQYTLSNKTMSDAVIFAPEPVGVICIDSKFPLEGYNKMCEDKTFKNEFRNSIKKHINDISSKYIIEGETSSIAILFLPAEAIFAEIHAYHDTLIEYAREKGVWIASPTTLMALLTTIMAVVRDIKTKEQAKQIQEELIKLSKNFKLYKDRWEKLSSHIDTVHKDARDIYITTTKISDEFEKIQKVDFKDDIEVIEN